MCSGIHTSILVGLCLLIGEGRAKYILKLLKVWETIKVEMLVWFHPFELII